MERNCNESRKIFIGTMGNKLRVILFALPGFGNTVLKSLIQSKNIEIVAVYTQTYDKPFPYYKEEALVDCCKRYDVVCYCNENVNSEEVIKRLQKESIDLAVVATFKQIFKKEILGVPAKGFINIHPSLLPKYKGPTPTQAVLMNDEKYTGVTIHYLDEEIDGGNILLQRSIEIKKKDNDGILRLKLAILAGRMISGIIPIFLTDKLPLGQIQNKNEGFYTKKYNANESYLESAKNVDEIRNKIRAFNPYPGTSITLENTRIFVNRYKLIANIKKINDGIYIRERYIDVFLNKRGIRLYRSI